MQNSIDNYKKAIRNYFSFLKNTDRLDDLHTKSIALKDNMGFLIPVCKLHATDEKLIKKFAEWRQLNTRYFPSQFTVTLEGTSNWLRKGVLEVEDRILFLVVDKHGHT